jgi:Kef-type K+ transport system membrane component KefB
VIAYAAAPPPPSLTSQQTMVLLCQLSVLLVLAMVFGRLATKLRMPAVAGELLVGVLLGPSILGRLPAGLTSWLSFTQATQVHMLDSIGQVAVILLVGMAGMEMDTDLARRAGTSALRIGAAGLVVPLGLGVGLGFLLPAEMVAGTTTRTTFALFVGVALSLSALPVIVKILQDLRMQHRNVGQLIIASAVFDDVVGWLLLAVVSAMATAGTRGGSILLTLVWLPALVVFAATIGRRLVHALLHRAVGWGPAGSSATVVALLLVSAAVTQAAGYEGMLGAFACGMLISRSPDVDAAALRPVRTFVVGVLAPIYFAMAGLRIDLTALAKPAVLLTGLAVLVVAVVGKLVGAGIGAAWSRLNRWEGLAVAAGLNARGIIAIVVATTGVRLGVLNSAAYTIIVLLAIATSLIAPPVLRFAVRRLDVTAEEQLRADRYEEPLPVAAPASTDHEGHPHDDNT